MQKLSQIVSEIINNKRKLSIIFCLLLLLITFSCNLDHPLDSDEGTILNMAWHWWNGQALYTKFYELIAPGNAAMIVAFWHLLGPTYFAAKLGYILSCYVSVLAIYLIVFKLSAKHMLAFVAALWWILLSKFAPIISHNSESAYIAVVVLYLLLLFTDKPKKLYIFAAAILCAIDVFFLQTKGFLITFASALIISAANTNKRIQNTLGFLAIFVVTLCLLFRPWQISALWQNLVLLPININYLGSTFFDLSLFSIALSAIVIMIYKYYETKDRMYCVLAIFQATLYIGILHNLGLSNFAVASFPAIILVNKMAMETKKINPEYRSIIEKSYYFFTLLLVVFAIDLASPSKLLFKGGFSNKVPQEVQKAESIYAAPFLPGVYFELGKINYFDTLSAETLCRSACQEKGLNIFQSTKPEFVLLAFSMTTKYNYFLEDSSIGKYVVSNYKSCGEIKGTYIDLYARDECPTNSVAE